MRNDRPLIMCVDDDQDVLLTLRTILEANGYEVEEAATAQEALEKVPGLKIDLFLVDIMMESVDAGLEFVKTLRTKGYTAPMYILSSVGDGLVMNADFSEFGLNGVFQKPIRSEQLLRILKSKIG